jgi:uncharacterized membrane protein YphA (DoxX/SURF4 family)
VVGPLSDSVGAIPPDPELMVRLNGAVQVGAGVLLAIGKFRRLAALALIASIVPTALAGHRFWGETDQAARTQQRMHFLKNLGLLGGLILAALATEGEPSLGWRAKHRVHELESAIALGRAASNSNVHRAARKSEARAQHARTTFGPSLRSHVDLDSHRTGAVETTAAELVPPAVRDGLRNASGAAMQALLNSSGTATDAVQQATSGVSKAVRQLEPLAESVTRTGLDVAGSHLTLGAQKASDTLSRFGDLATT